MFKILIAISVLFFLTNPIWQHNLVDAKVQAKKENKLILLNFSGSDWCIPCIKLHNEIFNAEVFTNYATNNLILVNVDFPRTKKNQLSKDQQKINETLADRYNPKGNFPLTILLDSDGNKIKVWDGFYKDGAQKFVEEIKQTSTKN